MIKIDEKVMKSVIKSHQTTSSSQKPGPDSGCAGMPLLSDYQFYVELLSFFIDFINKLKIVCRKNFKYIQKFFNENSIRAFDIIACVYLFLYED